MDNLITVNNQEGTLVVSSREIANNFEKRHEQVLRVVDSKIENMSTTQKSALFVDSSYVASNGKENKEYLLTRDGFSFIVMGFTGEKADQWKLKYIEAFNMMEQEIKKQAIPSDLSPQLQFLINMELQQKEIQKVIAETKREVESIRDTIIINPGAEWRKEVNRILQAMGKDTGDYRKPRNDSYEALETRARCRPNVLVNNLKDRALKNGMAKSKVDNLGMLDVLENEPRLREIYVTIVKEMAIKYSVA